MGYNLRPGKEGMLISNKCTLHTFNIQGDESSEGCLSSGEKKRVESTLLQGGSVELSTASSDVTTRATSVQSRAADDENSSPTGGNKNGKRLLTAKPDNFTK